MKAVLLIALLFISSLSLVSFKKKSNESVHSIAVIVNKANPVSELSASEVKLYYLRRIKKRWPVINKNIRPADQKKQCEERSAFYSLLGLSDFEVEQYFVTKQLQNAERPPDKFSTEAELIRFVEDEIGAIGYIRASSVTPEVLERVKVVFTR
jgi:ABC-type phosphate transport system substrate-binding protein